MTHKPYHKRIADNSVIRISIITSLYNCFEYLPSYFKHVIEVVNLHECEIVLIHNEPRVEEWNEIYFHLVRNEQINYVYIPVPREGLYKSWNRGIKDASGDFIAVWNVDDVRFPDSLLNQANAIDQNIDTGIVYGDKYLATGIADPDLRLIIHKDISSNKWMKRFQDGSLIMWRKAIHEKIGFFDEQFVSAGDQEMWYRTALYFRIVKVNSVLGIFVEHPKSISQNNINNGESFVIGARYGFYNYNMFNGFRAGIKKYDLRLRYHGYKTSKVPIFRYKHLLIYTLSIFNLCLHFALVVRKHVLTSLQYKSK